MSNRNYESQILDAIQILVDDAVSKADYDKTIKATISRCVDPTIGKYIIKYQDSSFYAYSYNTENTYSAGTAVYVLIPGNDMSQEKSIIGTVDKLGIDYVSIIEGENGYEVTGLNVITSHSEYGLCSYNQSDVKILYHRDENINLIELDTFGFKKYIEQSEAIICGATFKTSLSSQQKTRGDYGIVFDLDFIDNSTGEEVTRSYMLNIDQMTGQPYNFTFPSRQYDIFDVDGANFISVKQIYIFAYDFPYTEENKADDIFVSKIELSAANALDREVVSTAALSFITPQGIYFDENNLDSDIKTIEAQIKIKGQNIDNDSQKDNIDYYWFKENGNITTKSQQYNQIGGAGWECLNSYSIIEEATESQDAIVTWVPGDYKIYVSKENHIARETKYKCVAVYKQETTLSKTISIFNYDSNYDITITSDEGTAFYYDSGTPTLTCYINGQEQLGEDYVYAWTSMDSGNRFSNIQETSDLNNKYNEALARYNELQEGVNNHTLLLSEVEEEMLLHKQTLDKYEYTMRVEKNKIHQLKISEITKFTTYKCSVFKSGVMLGTASITISNSLENNTGYSVVINNGNQVFKYNEQGIAPNCPALENPITVLPLSFTIYDNQGREVSSKTLKQHEIKWYVPIDKTLIDIESIYPNPDEIHGSMGLYYDLHELSLNLANRFNATNDNNIIKLEIEYQGNKLSTQTSFVFTKTGEVGTNGTDFICKIIPNTNDIAPMNPIVTYNEYSKTYKINYNCLNNKWFKVQLWNDGENIFEGTQNGVSSEGKEVKVTWSILKNDYGKDIQDFSNLTIDKNTGVITFVENEYEHPANIVKCSIKYNNAEYYAVIPVITSRVKNDDYEILLTDGYGYKSVMYTTDGVSPSYDTTSPHDITVNQIINGVKSNISLYESKNYRVDYEWLIKGNAYYLKWQPSQNLLKNTRYKTKENRNRKFFKPSDTYNGLCVNNAIECIITQNGEKVGSIHMPIHLYLNRYGNSAMNGWDGNSISVGDNNGKQLILAPQVGAGTKDDVTNQFTGVFMGSIQEAGKDKEEHGLFGYSGGERTIALSSTDGSARFGKAGLGQIVIDPSTNQALITSGNYNEDEGKGMAINLSEPSIKFANGNFEVDKDGQIWATQYATKNMKFDSSSVNGLDDRLDGLDTTVEDLNATINYLDVVLPTNNVTVETSTLRIPTHTDTKTIECLTTYKGTTVKPTVKIEGSHPGITNVSSSYDTERGLTILSFHVDSTQAISDATNNYNVTFSYNQEGCSPVTKIVSVLVIEKGKDGTSVNIKGTEKNITDLCKNHSSGNVLGDGYVLEDDGNGETGHLFIFTNEGGGNGSLAADWKDVGRIQGNDGIDGRGVESITYQYLTTESSVKPDATDSRWEDIMEVPTNDKRYLWQKETITFIEIDGQHTEQDTVLLLAVYGEAGNGIKSTEVGYQIWTDGTTIPTGIWLTDPPATKAGDYLWTRIRITYTTGEPIDSYSITYIGKDGKIGADGRGIKSTTIDYIGSTNGTSKPADSENWTPTIPTVAQGNYLWTRTTITYTDNETTKSYSVSRIGTDGADGAAGKDGKGIISTTIDYQASSSGIETPTGNWTTSIPMVAAGQYLWTRTTIDYTEGPDSVSYSVGKMGNDGAQGANGTSITIKSTSVTYQAGTSGINEPTGVWNPTVPNISNGQYLWTKTEVIYSDNTSTTAYSVSYKGTNGTNGTNGKDGTSVTILSKAIEYQTSTSGITTPTGTWSPTVPSVTKGQYLWTRTTVTYSTGDKVVSYSVAYQGTNGTNGKDGTSVTVKTTSTTYQTSSSPTAVPTGTWSNSVVATDTTKKYLWTKVIVTFSDGKEATSYSVSSTMDSIAIGGRNLLLGTKKAPTKTEKNYRSWFARHGEYALNYRNEFDAAHEKVTWGGLGFYLNSVLDFITADNEITFSCEVTNNTTIPVNIAFFLMQYNASDTRVYSAAVANRDVLSLPVGGSKKASMTWKVEQAVLDSIAEGGRCEFTLQCPTTLNDTNVGEGLYFYAPKLELGNITTDWSSAPEDTEEGISKAQNTAETAQSEAGAAKQTADSAIDQIKNANDSIKGLNDSQTTLNNKVDSNQSTSVKDVYIEYCQKPYSWKQIASGSAYSEGTIYYSYDSVKKSYSKVRPKVDAGKLKESVYVKDALAAATDADTWVRSRPQWQDGMVTFQRTIVELHNGKKLPTTIYQMEDYQTIDDLRYLDASNVLSEMRGKNYIFYNEDGLFVYNGQTKEQSTNAIVINKEGICFQRRKSLTDSWPTPTSVWTIDGTFNAQDILVTNLNAESIVDGVLTLGNSSKDGELLVKDDTNKTLIELSSQRAIWSLIGEQYVIIGKDCGFQLVDNKGNQKYGSSLTWTQVTTGTYKNNVNYYTSKNLLSLIPEVTKNEKGEVTSVLAGTAIPSSGVYTVSYQEVFEVVEQKITGSTNYGGYVQTVNINTTDENGKKHKGLAFVPKR